MSANVRLGHVSVVCQQPERVAGFYQSLLGLEVSMQDSIPAMGDFVFLSRRAEDELPLIALVAEPSARHNAVEVDTLAELREVYAQAAAKGIQPSFVLSHGCSLSAYFHDPEGNVVEVFWGTGRKTTTPVMEVLELDALQRSEADLLELLATHV